MGDGRVVVKRYHGPDAAVRRRREHDTLQALASVLPVPPVVRLDDADGTLTMGHVEGVQGQDLMARGEAETRAVLASCGRILAAIQDVRIGSAAADGQVLVHGDFGPNNLLFDPSTYEVAAILDWEFTHTGGPVEDLVWCEWIVRMHSPDRVPLLGELFTAYGREIPDWPERREAMLARCRELRAFAVWWSEAAVAKWDTFIATTSTWGDATPLGSPS